MIKIVPFQGRNNYNFHSLKKQIFSDFVVMSKPWKLNQLDYELVMWVWFLIDLVVLIKNFEGLNVSIMPIPTATLQGDFKRIKQKIRDSNVVKASRQQMHKCNWIAKRMFYTRTTLLQITKEIQNAEISVRKDWKWKKKKKQIH